MNDFHSFLIEQDNKIAAYLLAGGVSGHPDFPFTEWLDALEQPGGDYSAAVVKAQRWLTEEKVIGAHESLMLAFGAYDHLQIDDLGEIHTWHRSLQFVSCPYFDQNLPGYTDYL